jgi:hypothetical protein
METRSFVLVQHGERRGPRAGNLYAPHSAVEGRTLVRFSS